VPSLTAIRIRSVSLDTLEALDYEASGFRETLELSSVATIVSIGSVSSARLNATFNAILA